MDFGEFSGQIAEVRRASIDAGHGYPNARFDQKGFGAERQVRTVGLIAVNDIDVFGAEKFRIGEVDPDQDPLGIVAVGSPKEKSAAGLVLRQLGGRCRAGNHHDPGIGIDGLSHDRPGRTLGTHNSHQARAFQQPLGRISSYIRLGGAVVFRDDDYLVTADQRPILCLPLLDRHDHGVPVLLPAGATGPVSAEDTPMTKGSPMGITIGVSGLRVISTRATSTESSLEQAANIAPSGTARTANRLIRTALFLPPG
jgi:hypothetical protein